MSSTVIATFTLVDYFVFLVMIVGSLGIGIYYGIRGNKTTEDFLLAGRSMSPFPVGLSMIATFISAISILGENVFCIKTFVFVVFSHNFKVFD